MMNIDELIDRLRHVQANLRPHSQLCKESADAIETLRAELERKASSLATVSNALTYAESQASEWRCKAGALENELRRAELDKADLRAELEEFRSMWNDPAKLHVSLLRRGYDRMCALHLAGATDYDAIKRDLDEARKDAGAKQAEIDRLMLEYCPDEMTAEQKAEWAAHQRPAARQQQG